MTDLQMKSRLEKYIKELPVLPHAVVRLMSLDPEQDEFFDQLLEIVETEPSYTARILSMANSAASGSQVAVTTPRVALSRIGSRGARDLIVALAVTRVFVPSDDWEKSLWRHSLHVAVAARELARVSDHPELLPDEAFTCGLLHDVGRFVLFQEGPEQLRQVDEGEWDSGVGLLEMEESVCGLTHTDIGALACKHWNLPEVIRECVRNHHGVPEAALEGPPVMLSATVQVADIAMFSTAMPGTPGLEEADDDTLRERVHAQLPPFLKLSIPKLRALLTAASEEARRSTEALGLN